MNNNYYYFNEMKKTLFQIGTPAPMFRGLIEFPVVRLVHLVRLVQLGSPIAGSLHRPNCPVICATRASRATRATRMLAEIAIVFRATRATRPGPEPPHERSAKSAQAIFNPVQHYKTLRRAAAGRTSATAAQTGTPYSISTSPHSRRVTWNKHIVRGITNSL
jgi:hypothetical protein